MRASLLISTYNWPEALELVLKSVENQSIIPFEVLIADDGSTVETKKFIEEFKMKNSLNIKHVWHKDDGFKKTKILNKAVAMSKADYIIQVDGDCILHQDFVKDHIASSQKNTFLYGVRAYIRESALQDLFEEQVIEFEMFDSKLKSHSRSMRIPILKYLYSLIGRPLKKVRGSNLSFFRSDFIAVNGYNEAIKGWGGEDLELVERMKNSGLYDKKLKFGAIQYHIWHKENSKNELEENLRLYETIKENKVAWIDNGVDKYIL